MSRFVGLEDGLRGGSDVGRGIAAARTAENEDAPAVSGSGGGVVFGSGGGDERPRTIAPGERVDTGPVEERTPLPFEGRGAASTGTRGARGMAGTGTPASPLVSDVPAGGGSVASIRSGAPHALHEIVTTRPRNRFS